MPWIVGTLSPSRRTKRLTRARGGPEGPVGRDASKLAGKGPPSDPSEEVVLNEALEVAGPDVGDGSAVDPSPWNKSLCDEPLEPVGGSGVVFIVVILPRSHRAYRTTAGITAGGATSMRFLTSVITTGFPGQRCSIARSAMMYCLPSFSTSHGLDVERGRKARTV